MKSKWCILFISIICLSIVSVRLADGKNTPFEWDKLGYYSYLPAAIIYHDIGTLSFYPEVIKKYELAGTDYWFATFPQAEGRRLNKYAVGTSIFQLPLFLLAHLYAGISGRFPADGFSLPYQYAAALSTVMWVLLALIVLRKFLLKYFSDHVVSITLVCIALGTNLFDYTVLITGMSHPFSFFLFAVLLYCTYMLYHTGKSKYLYLLAAVLGFIVIVRPVNVIVALVPALWGVNSVAALKERMSFFRIMLAPLFLSAFILLLITMIQLGYWKFVTGHWVYFSYQGEGFNFDRPEIRNGLFSWRKGWFIYTPIAFIGCLGFYNLWKRDRSVAPVLVSFFVIFIYVIFSWWNWYYGASFGCRPLIESLAILSMPLAAFFTDLNASGRMMKTITYTIISFFVALNLFQTYQHSKNIIHFDRMTAAYYWKIFGKTRYNSAYKQYLMTEEEYVRDFDELKSR